MSYQEDNEKHMDECKAAHALWEVWQKTKKDEDKDIWWKALSGITNKKYITLQMTIWPEDGVDIEQLKEMIENGNVNLPWLNHNIYHGDKVIAEVIRARASTWPKPAM